MNIHTGSYLDKGFTEHFGIDKFDIIVMNPPYQELKEGFKKSQALWDKFVIKTVSDLIEGGYLVAVHPDGWRSPKGVFKTVQNLLTSKQLLYLEMHNVKDGVKTFGATTTYDFYCLHNVPCAFNTKIKCQDGVIEIVNLAKMEFIPNAMFKEFEKLITNDPDEKVIVQYDRTAYETRKEYISREQTEEFKYPCVYLTYKDGSIKLMYSSTNQNGHFGIPKVIFSNGGASKPVIDINGEYGLTQFAYGIEDNVDNLHYIQKAMLTPEFIKLMYYACGNTGNRYHYKVIALFRKDFWKDFI